jgi:hypothetical protein
MATVHTEYLTGLTDTSLLNRYRQHLADHSIGSTAGAAMLKLAHQFLGWWRKNYVGEEFALSPRAGNAPTRKSEWDDVRETYLRATCPDHQMRCEQRNELNQFAHFMAGAH